LSAAPSELLTSQVLETSSQHLASISHFSFALFRTPHFYLACARRLERVSGAAWKLAHSTTAQGSRWQCMNHLSQLTHLQDTGQVHIPAAFHLFPAVHSIEPRRAGPWTHTLEQSIADQSSRLLGRSTASHAVQRHLLDLRENFISSRAAAVT
jgi:hypothetical protein